MIVGYIKKYILFCFGEELKPNTHHYLLLTTHPHISEWSQQHSVSHKNVNGEFILHISWNFNEILRQTEPSPQGGIAALLGVSLAIWNSIVGIIYCRYSFTSTVGEEPIKWPTATTSRVSTSHYPILTNTQIIIIKIIYTLFADGW